MTRFDSELVRCLPRLHAFARRLTGYDAALADDLVQDTCVSALAASERFELGTNMDAWLATILRNRFLSLAKRHARRFEFADEDTLARSTSGAVPQQGRLEMMALADAFGRLRPVEQRALMLAATEDVSYHQIADSCHCAVGTVKSRVSRARAQLAVDLERSGNPRAN